MDRETIDRCLKAEIEVLAEIEHGRWSHWQRYMHSTGERLEDGSLVLPAELVRQWDHQISTPYTALTEKEKESDREQVRKYLPTIVNALSAD